MDPKPAAERDPERTAFLARALGRHRARLARKLEALRGDLAEAERAGQHRRAAETLLVYLAQIPPRATRVELPDPGDPAASLEIALDPALRPQENAARYFKRAAKAERGLLEIPPRLAAVEAELRSLEHLLERVSRVEEHQPLPEGSSIAHVLTDLTLDRDLEAAYRRLPPALRRGGRSEIRPGRPGPASDRRAVPGRLEPRRFRTREGWDVLVGRSNEGNDYLTHRLARPEDYWFHVHGAAGSHVVLRRGKGRNEPSRRTIEEVAAWAAFHSRARTAGAVPVLVTRKRYVRKPRKAPPGLAVCEREKMVMVRPQEPPRPRRPEPAAGEGEAQ